LNPVGVRSRPCQTENQEGSWMAWLSLRDTCPGGESFTNIQCLIKYRSVKSKRGLFWHRKRMPSLQRWVGIVWYPTNNKFGSLWLHSKDYWRSVEADDSQSSNFLSWYRFLKQLERRRKQIIKRLLTQRVTALLTNHSSPSPYLTPHLLISISISCLDFRRTRTTTTLQCEYVSLTRPWGKATNLTIFCFGNSPPIWNPLFSYLIPSSVPLLRQKLSSDGPKKVLLQDDHQPQICWISRVAVR